MKLVGTDLPICQNESSNFSVRISLHVVKKINVADYFFSLHNHTHTVSVRYIFSLIQIISQHICVWSDKGIFNLLFGHLQKKTEISLFQFEYCVGKIPDYHCKLVFCSFYYLNEFRGIILTANSEHWIQSVKKKNIQIDR